MNAHLEISAHQKNGFFKEGSTQNWWGFMDLECFLLLLKIKRPGRLFRQTR